MHTDDDKKNLHQIYTLTGHEIESIDDLYLDGNLVLFGLGSQISPYDPRWAIGGTKPNGDPIDYDSRVFMSLDPLGTDTQTAQNDAVVAIPTFWTTNHRQLGCAHTYVIFKWDPLVFPDGIPEAIFSIHGKKVFDPRDSSTTFQNNTALCIADYLIDPRYGPGFTIADIDTGTDPGGLQWAADICDEQVPLKAGGTENRYLCNAAFDMDMSHDEIISDLETAMAGYITYTGGKFKFWPATYITPSVTLTMDDLRGPVKIETLIGRRENFNAIRGTFVSKDKNYEVTDFPSQSLPAEVTKDGQEVFEDISLPCTTSQATAQRIAMIELRRIREALTVKAPFGLAAFQLEVGDTVMLTMSRYGWSSKVFRIADFEFSWDATALELITDLVLREENSAIYDWDETTEEKDFDLAANTDLPDPFEVEVPTGLTLESGTDQLQINSDGHIISRLKVSWTPPLDEFVQNGGFIEIQSKPSAGAFWQQHGPALGNETQFFIVGLQDGATYDVRIRAVSALGIVSDWVTVTNHFLVGKTQVPDNVEGLTIEIQENGLQLAWPAVDDLDLSHYEIRRGAVWETATGVIDNVTATDYFDPFLEVGSVTYLIKAFDTTGNESAGADSETVIPIAPGIPENLLITTIDNNVLIDWEPPATGSFTIDYYNVYKGATATSDNLIGRAYGTFSTFFTVTSESTTIFVEPVDIGGNAGTVASKDVDIFPPPNFELQSEAQILISDGTLVNAHDNGPTDTQFVAPIVTPETWAAHFTTNSQTTIQGFIDAGYTAYAEPAYTVADGTFEAEFDLGAVLNAGTINFLYSVKQLGTATATVTPTISYKELSGDPWTDVVGVQQTSADTFQFIKFLIEVDAGGDDKALVLISNMQYQVDVKIVTDSGTGTSSASTPVTVNFNVDFLDVQGITVTVEETSEGRSAVIDFNDIPNPTGFDVRIFKNNNNQVSNDFRWVARGIVNPP
ncbi:MAG: hypothetical protein GTN64_05495 [Candidatus Latescibacteria bacterium]|nr:hypothetical protein [Candidatus Latescibacterota bacterium]NIO78064.1 hypothetical protein [Candidatus Latescibacterota bacterium]